MGVAAELVREGAQRGGVKEQWEVTVGRPTKRKGKRQNIHILNPHKARMVDSVAIVQGVRGQRTLSSNSNSFKDKFTLEKSASKMLKKKSSGNQRILLHYLEISKWWTCWNGPTEALTASCKVSSVPQLHRYRSHMWLLRTCNAVNATKKQFLILADLNSYMRSVVTILNRTARALHKWSTRSIKKCCTKIKYWIT